MKIIMKIDFHRCSGDSSSAHEPRPSGPLYRPPDAGGEGSAATTATSRLHLPLPRGSGSAAATAAASPGPVPVRSRPDQHRAVPRSLCGCHFPTWRSLSGYCQCHTPPSCCSPVHGRDSLTSSSGGAGSTPRRPSCPAAASSWSHASIPARADPNGPVVGPATATAGGVGGSCLGDRRTDGHSQHCTADTSRERRGNAAKLRAAPPQYPQKPDHRSVAAGEDDDGALPARSSGAPLATAAEASPRDAVPATATRAAEAVTSCQGPARSRPAASHGLRRRFLITGH